MRHVPLLTMAIALASAAYGQRTLEQKLQDLPPAQSLIPDAVFDAANCYAGEGLGTVDVVETDDRQPGRAFRGTVAKQPENPWQVGLQLRTTAKIETGDALLVTARARRLDSKTEPAQIRLVCRRVAKPYAHSLGAEVTAKDAWTQIAVPFVATTTTAADEAVLIIHFGMQVQTAEVKDIQLLNFGKGITLGRLTAALGIRSVKKGTQGVGEPLSPGLLHELQAFDTLPTAPSDFTPDGAGTNTYTIWTCHGQRSSGNRVVGLLRIARRPGSGDTFSLDVDQHIVNDEGGLHKVHAEIECRRDTRATPVRWTLDNQFIGPDGKQRPEPATRETATVTGASVELTVGERVFTRAGSAQIAADWCLFEAVQRLPFAEGTALTFDVLEGLSLLKRGQRLAYRGEAPVPIGDSMLPMHRFSQIGHGILPYEYWLDEQHRLQFVITHSRAYILDDDAETKLANVLKSQRGRFDRVRKREEAEEAKQE